MGSAPFKFSWADALSVLKHAVISAVSIAAPVILSDAQEIGRAAASAAIAAAASTALKLLQKFVTDTRPVPPCLASARRHKK